MLVSLSCRKSRAIRLRGEIERCSWRYYKVFSFIEDHCGQLDVLMYD